MMNDMKKKKSGINFWIRGAITVLLSLLLIGVTDPGHAMAAGATVTFSVSSEEIRVGDPVSVTMTVTADVVPGTVSAYISYDPSLLEYVTGPTGVAGGEGVLKLTDPEIGNKSLVRKYTFVFLASKMGTATVTLSRPPQITDESEGDLMSVLTDQITFDILTSLKASSDATLSSLKVSPGKLEPAFDPAITEYSVMVGADTDELIVSAFANDAFGKVAVSGNTGLIPGQNRVVLTVTAEDGSEQFYVIYALKPQPEGDAGDGSDRTDSVPGADRITANDAAPAPAEPVHAFYLMGEEGNLKLVSDSIYSVVEDGSGVTVPEGYTRSAVRISGFTVTAYAPAGEADPGHLLLVLSPEEGQPGLYVYDRSEKTVQRYDLIPHTVTVQKDGSSEELDQVRRSLEKTEKSVGTLIIVVIILGVLLLLAILVIVRIVTVRRASKRRSRQ